MNKKIYYSNLLVHNYIKNLIKNPPEGYEFIVFTDNKKQGIVNSFKQNKVISFIYKRIVKRIFNVWNILNKVYYKTSPENTDIILTTSSVIFENKPWIIKILDSPFSMAGNDYNLFIKNLKPIEKALESSNCKKIIVHTKICKEYMKKYFSKRVIDKVILINPAIPKEIIKRSNRKKEINFLFMGSINNPAEFYLKGGLETLETFKKLREKYNNIYLTMRCKLPEELKRSYLNLKTVSFIETFLSEEDLNKLYLKSDVLFLPGYNYFIMAYLEAFSYGIPIIALDTYGVSEFIIDSKNGFLVKPSKNLPIKSPDYPVNARSREFIKIIKKGDSMVIGELAKKASILIENKKLLNKMSNTCQKMFKKKYSWERKSMKLKRVFDEALM